MLTRVVPALRAGADPEVESATAGLVSVGVVHGHPPDGCKVAAEVCNDEWNAAEPFLQRNIAPARQLP